MDDLTKRKKGLENNRKWMLKNHKKRLEYLRKYHHNHKDFLNARRRARRLKNLTRAKAMDRRKSALHSIRRATVVALWREKHPLYHKIYRQKNREKINRQSKERRDKHKSKK